MATSGFISVVLMAAATFVGLSPQLGGTPTKADKQAYAKSGHYQDGEFVNLLHTRALTGRPSRYARTSAASMSTLA